MLCFAVMNGGKGYLEGGVLAREWVVLGHSQGWERGVGGCGTGGKEGRRGGVFGGGGGESVYDVKGAGGAVLLGVGAGDDARVGGVGWGGEVGGFLLRRKGGNGWR